MKLSEELTQLHNSGDCGLMVEGMAEKAYQLEQQRDQLKDENAILNRVAQIFHDAPKADHIFTNSELAEHDADVIDKARIYAASQVYPDDLAENYDLALLDLVKQLRQKAQEPTCDLECGAYGTYCKCKTEKAQEEG